MKKLLLLLVLFVVQTIAGENVLNTEVTWSRCSSDVEESFLDVFPDYVITPNGRRRTSSLKKKGILKQRRRRLFQDAKGSSLYIMNQHSGFNKNGTFETKSHIPLLMRNPPPRVEKPTRTDSRLLQSDCNDCSTGCCSGIHFELECGTFRLPSAFPAGVTNVTTTVYHIKVKNVVGSRKHLWLLQGGPGAAGATILFLASFGARFATDIYIPDHRGTGQSSELQCRIFENDELGLTPNEIASCRTVSGLDWNDYTVSQAARDLMAQIKAVHTDAVVKPSKIYVHGFSYGTRWLSRLLQLYPDGAGLVNKVVLEGNVNNQTYFNDFPLGMQFAGSRLMEKCSLDATCNAKVSLPSISDKDAVIEEYIRLIVNDVNNNPCTVLMVGENQDEFGRRIPDAIYKESIRTACRSMLQNSIINANIESPVIDFRTIAVAMLRRWSRCSNEDLKPFIYNAVFNLHISGGSLGGIQIKDVDLLKNQKNNVKAAGYEETLDSQVLYNLIRHSELWEYPTPPDYSRFDQVTWGTVTTFEEDNSMALKFDPSIGPATTFDYPDDPIEVQSPSNISIDVLIVNGEIDGQTSFPEAEDAFRRLTVFNSLGRKFFALIPNFGHAATDNACGVRILNAYYSASSPQPDIDACAIPNETVLLPLAQSSWTPSKEVSLLTAGGEDIWEGDVDSSLCVETRSLGSCTPSSNSRCLRCFDYCLLTTQGNGCDCVASLGACLANTMCDSGDALSTCEFIQDTYVELSPSLSSCSCTALPLAMIIGIVVGVIGFILLVACGCCFYIRYKNKQRLQNLKPAATFSPPQAMINTPAPSGVSNIPTAVPAVVIYQATSVPDPSPAPPTISA